MIKFNTEKRYTYTQYKARSPGGGGEYGRKLGRSLIDGEEMENG